MDLTWGLLVLGAIAGMIGGVLGAAIWWSIGVFASGHGWLLTQDQLLALETLATIGMGAAGMGLGVWLDSV